MTRINLIPASELSDQHLLAEYRELPRVNSVIDKKTFPRISNTYVLGTGHVNFFINKANFLEDRHKELVNEALKRGIKISNTSELEINRFYPQVSFIPSVEEIKISESRIFEKLLMKPSFYKYKGISYSEIPKNFWLNPSLYL